MEYITRDLQHKTKEILDKATSAPVRIRRGSEFFEIYKVKASFEDTPVQKNNFVPQAETTIIEDDQEWVEPSRYVPPVTTGKQSLEDLMNSGMLRRGA